ncbi:MAG: putative transposase [Flavobacterium sp.]|jgi:putative transposase
MLEFIELLIHFVTTVFKRLKPGGVKVVMAETIAIKQQLIVLNRHRKRAPALATSDRLLFGLLAMLISERRLQKVAVILKPATILAFHKALVKRKYSRLYSNKTKRTPDRKPQDQTLFDLVIEMKSRNPSFGISISRFAVGRILRKKNTTYLLEMVHLG